MIAADPSSSAQAISNRTKLRLDELVLASAQVRLDLDELVELDDEHFAIHDELHRP